MKARYCFLFLFFAVFFIRKIDAQEDITRHVCTLTWLSPVKFVPDENYSTEMLFFQGAIADNTYPVLPQFHEQVKVSKYYTGYEITLNNLITKPLTSDEIKLLPDGFRPTSLEVQARTLLDRGQNVSVFSFVPLFLEKGQWVKVLSVEVVLRGVADVSFQKKAGDGYTSRSVLASGQWYQVKVSRGGIHKVTYADLQAMGAPVQGLRSANIALFGNGGGMLPEKNNVSRSDDLTENAIKIYDGGDGSFDEGDYFIFYAQSPHTWSYQSSTRSFSHHIHIYSDYAYYFINLDAGIGSKTRVLVSDSSHLLTPNREVSTYTYYDFREEDKLNMGSSGNIWFYETPFDISTSLTLPFSMPGVIADSTVRVSVRAAATSPRVSTFTVSANNTPVGQLQIPASTATFMKTGNFYYHASSPDQNVVLNYDKPSSSSKGWLDWIEIEAACHLQMHSAQVPFCQPWSVSNGAISRFRIGNSTTNTIVWDITTPTRPFQCAGTLTSGTFTFVATTSTLRYFVAFNGTEYYSVTPVGKVSPQNLHADTEVDMVIVAAPEFTSEAERLAKFRQEQDALRVKVVSPNQIYNEFSSGAQDPTAIRDYVRMIYKKSNGNNPRYLLLFGRPSFDYRQRVQGTQLFVPNYQLDIDKQTIKEDNYRANDDYFGLLDDNEGSLLESGLLDIGIGRFPVTTVAQAKIAVDKTISYSTTYNLLPEAKSGEISNFGDWRNVITFVADDEDNNFHLNTAEASADTVFTFDPNINIEKIYCDAYQQMSNAGGQRYPEVTTAINNRMQRGSLVMAYLGHGGGEGWAHERILSLSDINNWSNRYNLALLVTLTCEFSWYDRIAISPGELSFLNPNGGAAGLITTSRVAFNMTNDNYSKSLYTYLLTKDQNGKYPTLGELNRVTKNRYNGNQSLHMIIVLGDPAMPVAFPRYKVITDSINGIDVSHFSDTLKALEKVTVKGHIADNNLQTLTQFNGNLFPSIFDKFVTQKTLQNDPESPATQFKLQKNVLFKGNVSVKNGHFAFTFIVPKDINYQYGTGKFSYYARMQNADAAGSRTDILMGGISDHPVKDSIGPDIEVYLNDETFVDGSITNPNPTLLVYLNDDMGINTTGNGIGHDITATIDNGTPLVLNDYYEAKQDSYNSGTVRYPLKDLSIGQHVLEIKAWDIANNPSSKTLRFEVVSDEKLTLAHVLNYPNPFTTNTAFYFEQNHPGENFDILIQVFTISGRIVRTLTDRQQIDGNRSKPVFWDGRDDFGDRLAKGVYLYRLKVRDSQNQIAEKVEKLVIL